MGVTISDELPATELELGELPGAPENAAEAENTEYYEGADAYGDDTYAAEENEGEEEQEQVDKNGKAILRALPTMVTAMPGPIHMEEAVDDMPRRTTAMTHRPTSDCPILGTHSNFNFFVNYMALQNQFQMKSI